MNSAATTSAKARSVFVLKARCPRAWCESWSKHGSRKMRIGSRAARSRSEGNERYGLNSVAPKVLFANASGLLAKPIRRRGASIGRRPIGRLVWEDFPIGPGPIHIGFHPIAGNLAAKRNRVAAGGRGVPQSHEAAESGQ